MFKNVWVTLILHTFLSLCGHIYGFLLSSVHLTILFRQVFFLHSAFQTRQGESSFLGNLQLVALPLSCYEQLCSSCQKEAAGAGCFECNRPIEFSNEGHLSDDVSGPCCCFVHGYHLSHMDFGFACFGQIFLCLLPVFGL